MWTISKKVRNRRFYSVPRAGAKIGMGRSESYRAAARGQIPTVREGKFLLVPREPWDRTARSLLGLPAKPSRKDAKPSRQRKATPVETK